MTVTQCNHDIEINGTTFYCLNEPEHEGEHRYQILSGDWEGEAHRYCQNTDYWRGKFEYLRDELEAIAAVEKDSPAALRAVVLIAHEALVSVEKGLNQK